MNTPYRLNFPKRRSASAPMRSRPSSQTMVGRLRERVVPDVGEGSDAVPVEALRQAQEDVGIELPDVVVDVLHRLVVAAVDHRGRPVEAVRIRRAQLRALLIAADVVRLGPGVREVDVVGEQVGRARLGERQVQLEAAALQVELAVLDQVRPGPSRCPPWCGPSCPPPRACRCCPRTRRRRSSTRQREPRLPALMPLPKKYVKSFTSSLDEGLADLQPRIQRDAAHPAPRRRTRLPAPCGTRAP